VNHHLRQLAQVIRLPLIGVTWTFILLGALASPSPLSLARVSLLLLIGVFYHCSVYAFNNIVDRNIDHTHPDRTDHMELSRLLGHRAAVATCIVAGLVPAMMLSSTHDRAVRASLAYLIALSGLLIYDIWGKSSPVPPLLDLVQGIGWGALTFAGATILGSASQYSYFISVWVVVYIVLVNGGHGALKDYPNDSRHGARTTATMFMGYRWKSTHLPVSYRLYIEFTNVLQTLGLAAIIVVSSNQEMRVLTEFLMCVFVVASLSLVRRGIRAYRFIRRLRRIGLMHILLCLLVATCVGINFAHSRVAVLVGCIQVIVFMTAANARAVWKAG
jgi:4-hydroxybenzoate polyprenyltransferase